MRPRLRVAVLVDALTVRAAIQGKHGITSYWEQPTSRFSTFKAVVRAYLRFAKVRPEDGTLVLGLNCRWDPVDTNGGVELLDAPGWTITVQDLQGTGFDHISTTHVTKRQMRALPQLSNRQLRLLTPASLQVSHAQAVWLYGGCYQGGGLVCVRGPSRGFGHITPDFGTLPATRPEREVIELLRRRGLAHPVLGLLDVYLAMCELRGSQAQNVHAQGIAEAVAQGLDDPVGTSYREAVDMWLGLMGLMLWGVCSDRGKGNIPSEMDAIALGPLAVAALGNDVLLQSPFFPRLSGVEDGGPQDAPLPVYVMSETAPLYAPPQGA